jgi:hypothetical protein
MSGNGHVEHAPTVMRQYEDKEEPARRGRDDEEIGRCDLADMIRQEGAPRL